MIAAYILSCIALAVTFQALAIWPRTQVMTHSMREAFGTMTDKALSDDEKEVALRRQSIALLVVTTRLTLALVVTFAAAAAPVVLAEQAGWISYPGFLAFSLDPLVIALTVLALAALPWLHGRFAARVSNGVG